MLRLVRYVFVVGMAVNMLACSSSVAKNNFISKRETEYLRASETAPLQLPPGVSSAGIGDDYIIPPAIGPVQQQVNLIPPGSLADGIARGVISPAVLKQKLEPAPAPTAAEDNVNPIMLTLDRPKTQMWGRIGGGLRRFGYVVVNENEFTGIYYVLDMTALGSRVSMDTPIYQVHVQDVNNVAQVYVTDNDGRNIPPDTAQSILTDIHNALLGQKPSPVMKFLKELF